MQSAKKGAETAGQRTVQRDSDTGNNPEDCPVCMTVFGGAARRPRNLPCGHTLCTSCINELTEWCQVTCPTCRVVHDVPEAGRFPISYITEDLIRKLKDSTSDSSPSKAGKDTEEPVQSQVTQHDHKDMTSLGCTIRSLLKEQEAKVLAAIRTCQDVHAQLNQYKTTLACWSGQQQQLQESLQVLVDKSRNAIALVQQDESQVTAKQEQVQHGEQKLHSMLQNLRRAITRQEAYKTIDDADHLTNEERERTEECQGMLPDMHTVTTIRKVMAASRAALKAAQTIEEAMDTKSLLGGAVGGPSLPTNSASTITERVRNLLAPTLQAEDLHSQMQPVRSLLEAGRVFAVHNVEGHSRHAKISLEDGRLYLSSLCDQSPPPGAAIIQVSEVVPPSPPCLVFLDLEWPGTTRRRVLVRLSPDTPMGRQFVMLCTGQRGPCYANTKLFEVVKKGKPGEWVAGGDYEKNNGSGGAALLPDLDMFDYRTSDLAGAVFRTYRGDDKSDWNARFGIRTKDREDEGVSKVFGKVEAGLDVLVAAAQHTPIKEVTVADCGVVL